MFDWLTHIKRRFGREAKGTVRVNPIPATELQATSPTKNQPSAADYARYGIRKQRPGFWLGDRLYWIRFHAEAGQVGIPHYLDTGRDIILGALERGMWETEGAMPRVLRGLIEDVSEAIEQNHPGGAAAWAASGGPNLIDYLSKVAISQHDLTRPRRDFYRMSPSEQAAHLEIKAEKARLEREHAALERQQNLEIRRRNLVLSANRVVSDLALVRDQLDTIVLEAGVESLTETLVAKLGEPDQLERFKRPAPLSHGVSAEGAELLTLEWLQYLGFFSACKTPFRRDGGVDVETSQYVVQTKNWERDFIPVSAVREIVGVAAMRGKSAMFFSRSAYSFDAVAEAEMAKVALFRFKAETGELLPQNSYAADIVSNSPNEIPSETLDELRALLASCANLVEKIQQLMTVFEEEVASSQMKVTDSSWSSLWGESEELLEALKFISSASPGGTPDGLFELDSLFERAQLVDDFVNNLSGFILEWRSKVTVEGLNSLRVPNTLTLNPLDIGLSVEEVSESASEDWDSSQRFLY